MVTLIHAKQNQMEAISIANFIHFPGLKGHVTRLLRKDDPNQSGNFYQHAEHLYTLINDQVSEVSDSAYI